MTADRSGPRPATSGLTGQAEDYLKAIYEMEQGGEAAATSDIAAQLSVAAASVTFMLAHLPPTKDMWLWTVSAGLLGVLFGGITLGTGDVITAVVAHAVVNGIGLFRLGKTVNAAK